MNAEKVLRGFFSPCSPRLSRGRLQAGPQAAFQTALQVNTHMDSTVVLNSGSRPSPSPACHGKNQPDTGAQRCHPQPIRNCLCDRSPLLNSAGSSYRV